jgi:2-O-(6-phospho-alpha-D-mannosyl)-D-glycerate hydrolase
MPTRAGTAEDNERMNDGVEAFLVTHTHWDREWYRTFQAFRARLVDTVDRVLDLIAADEGYHFVLDGQAVVLEDYFAIRPERQAELEAACASGRMGIGPWYVQPDMFLPSGEAHVRNLLEGRRVAAKHGPVSRVGYAPDSFGHPAQVPQILHGFGLDTFVYWRGNGSEIDRLPPRYAWVAPDGTAVTAQHLRGSYSGAGSLPWDDDEALARLVQQGEKQLAEGADRVVLMNGNDHTLPESRTAALAEALADKTGWAVRRALLDEAVLDGPGPEGLPSFTGDLIGGRVANLLPGVWSTRTYLKLRNRRCERLLEGWAEPFAAFGRALGLRTEQPALRTAWRALLVNQAHDSICGCSVDAVHDQMLSRYDEAGELAAETTARMLDRIAGLSTERLSAWADEVDIAVFNPNPYPVTDVVRIPVEGFPPISGNEETYGVHPLTMISLQRSGIVVDGAPARIVPGDADRRFRLVPEHAVWEAEVIARDVPAYGWRRMRLGRGELARDDVDDGPAISLGDVSVEADDAGTLSIRIGEQSWSGLFGFEDSGDRGDTYDYDPVPNDPGARVSVVEVRRAQHSSGIAQLTVSLAVAVPAGLTEDRSARADATVELPVTVDARIAGGVPRVDVTVTVDNRAPDHRLRVLFPVGARSVRTATTFDEAVRVSGHVDDSGWEHPAPTTWPLQGWVAASGLCVVAPGLNEGELLADGTIALTVLRSVGWLSRYGLATRQPPAGPGLPTPGAQCLGPLTAKFSVLADGPDVGARARAAELGLLSAHVGPNPLVEAGTALLSVNPTAVVVSALKPAQNGDGFIVRLLNAGADTTIATLSFGLPIVSVEPVRLDETPDTFDFDHDGSSVRVGVPPHALRSLRVRCS